MHQGALPTPMLKQESGLLRGGWSRPCDACRAAASAVFCRTDALYLCSACDSHAHHFPADASAHERVLVCEACEQAPAVFACKADAAALCVSCDMEIHSTPLASRHTRVLVLPITDDVPVRFGNCMFPTDGTGQKGQEVTWPFVDYQECGDRNFVEFLDCNMDVGESKPTSLHPLPQEDDCVYGYDRLELLLNHSGGQYEGDRHVPSPGGLTREWEEGRSLDVGLELGMIPKVEFMEHYNFYPLSPSYSREPYMVPDAAAATESSKSDTTPSKGTLDLFEQPIDRTAAAVDRQARLLRYREKKKKRNFEKTIRYASRKAYAEVRPRVKGRFAKIVMDSEPAMDRMLHATYSAELTYEYTYGYGVVPSY